MDPLLSDLLSQEQAPAEEIEDRSPNLRAEVVGVAASRDQFQRIRELVPDGIEVSRVDDPESVTEALSGNVAAVILPTEHEQSTLEDAVLSVLRESKHVQIVMLDTEASQSTPPVPHDEAFTQPVGDEDVQRMARVYVRAYYSSSTAAFFDLSITANNYRLSNEEVDERLERLERTIDLLERHLSAFRAFLEPADRTQLANREAEYTDYFSDFGTRFETAALGLPKACPNCGLDWTVTHGQRLGRGFERVAANTWRCTRCSNVLANPDSGRTWVS